MILESLRSANSTIIDSVRTTTDQQAVQQFKAQLGLLSQSTSQLEQLISIIKAIQTRKISTKVFTVEIKKSLQDSVDACGQKTSEHTLDVGTVTAFKNAIELCRKNVEIEWKDASNSLTNGIENSLVSLKSLLPDEKEADDILEALSKAKTSIPSSTKSIDQFMEDIRKGKELIDGLHLDEEAESFIFKVRTQTATVADLTPHIMKWLKDNNLTGQIKVSF